ncbi:MAG: glycosyltransferase family 9 protein [Magnetococcus sp. DMHC-8]
MNGDAIRSGERQTDSPALRILVMRKDNIGDLVCTTPLLRALREQLPTAWIGALVTAYNVPVLAANPDIDAVYSYRKAKHRSPGEGLAGIYLQWVRLLLTLRRQRIDWLLLPGGPHPSTLRLARWVAPRHLLVRTGDMGRTHEVECACALLPDMGLVERIPPLRLAAEAGQESLARQRLDRLLPPAVRRVVGVHISARKLSQRWPADNFVALLHALAALFPHWGYLLFWSPGAADNPLHPGDDAKAQHILAGGAGLPLVPMATTTLAQLIAGLGLCDLVVCADGGAMHLAAGLGKPMVALFGDSTAARWHPWGVPYQLLQKPTRAVDDIAVEEVVAAVVRLTGEAPAGGQGVWHRQEPAR